MFFVSAVYADEYVISKIDCYKKSYGNFDNAEISFKFFDDEQNIYCLQWSTYSHTYWFPIMPEDLEKMRATLVKSKEWTRIAKENKTEVTKEIPGSTINVVGGMKSGNDFYTTRRPIPLTFIFAANAKEAYYVLFIKGDSAKAKENEFIDIEFDTIGLYDYQIDDFIDAISPETIEKAKSKHQQEKKNAELFQ